MLKFIEWKNSCENKLNALRKQKVTDNFLAVGLKFNKKCILVR